MARKLILALLVTASLSLVACGGDDTKKASKTTVAPTLTSDPAWTVESITDEFADAAQEYADRDFPDVTADESDCLLKSGTEGKTAVLTCKVYWSDDDVTAGEVTVDEDGNWLASE